MTYVLAEDLTATAPPQWPLYLIAALLLALVMLMFGLVVNVNKMLSRINAIRRNLEDSKETGVHAQMQEALVQLQSMTVSLDRVAMRMDVIDTKLGDATAKGLGVGDSGLAEAVAALREGIEQLRAPVGEIRDLMGKTEVERIADEVRRALHALQYDQVVIRTDLSSLVGGDGKVHVEVSRSGVKSKGYLVLRAGSVTEHKINPTYEMFP
jgi:hypothetical protein